MPKWLKISLKVIGVIILLFVLLIVGATVYISFNKAKVLKMVNEQLDKSVDGTLVIGDMKPNFLKGYRTYHLRCKMFWCATNSLTAISILY